jgi:hypothetical protein
MDTDTRVRGPISLHTKSCAPSKTWCRFETVRARTPQVHKYRCPISNTSTSQRRASGTDSRRRRTEIQWKARVPKYLSRRQQTNRVCHETPTMHLCKGASRRTSDHAGYAKPSSVKHSSPTSPRPSFRCKPTHRLFVQAFQLSQTPERVCVARNQLRNRLQCFRVKV